MDQTAPQFRQVYAEVGPVLNRAESVADDEVRLTLSAEEMPLLYFLRWVSDRAGVSVVADSSLDGRPVSVDVREVPVSELLAVVARRLGVQVARTSNLYYLGNLRPEDRGVLVRKVPRLSREDLQGAVSTLLSEHGRVLAFEDGLLVVGDRVEVIGKVVEMLDGIERAGIEGWVVQLFVISRLGKFSWELGLDTLPALELAATAAVGSGSGAHRAVLRGGLAATLRAAAASDEIGIVAAPLVLVTDGASAEWSQVREVPIPRRTVSGEGTVTTTGFEFVPVGLRVVVGLRELGGSRAALSLGVELSDLEGFVEEAPIKLAQRLDTRAVIESGGVYLVGSIEREEKRAGKTGPFLLTATGVDSGGVIEVWARAYRVSGSVDDAQSVD